MEVTAGLGAFVETGSEVVFAGLGAFAQTGSELARNEASPGGGLFKQLAATLESKARLLPHGLRRVISGILKLLRCSVTIIGLRVVGRRSSSDESL